MNIRVAGLRCPRSFLLLLPLLLPVCARPFLRPPPAMFPRSDSSGSQPPLIRVKSAELVAPLLSASWTGVRDVGHSGVIDGKIIWTFGDTISKDKDGNMTGLAPNTAAYGDWMLWTSSSYERQLDDNDRPNQFVPYTQEEYNFWKDSNWAGDHRIGIWVSNVVQTGPGEGIAFYDKSSILTESLENIKRIGTGVAKVYAKDEGPIADRVHDIIFDAQTDPSWGCFTTYKEDDYIYAFGEWTADKNVYLSRVAVADVFSKDKYEYWNGQTWQSQSLTLPDEAAKVFWNIQSGTIWKSNHHAGKYVMLYMTNWADDTLRMMWSDSITGPWNIENQVQVMKLPSCENSFNYCGYAHPQFGDDSELLVSWTSPQSGQVQLGKITFE
ncbi:hypothetical protein NEOLI_002174 [Neolecta irregularis DAH-3]|uniref:DUF4185 domain-containing protein n=1 Tax=Neolecta irregularis (strain DAH-3) TaxID=1198029 RepID=A0A1U7LS99_NEOID|nr:hypothetical protein NEOLI_002174 [Neolecta irregularis DAH-3]|eukprot:OLL25545.1 hypothetical protein NEOLI_002174 [Neolecta irregularis DAH-3]